MFDVIAFDADDTLWHNEHNFIKIQEKFCEMLTQHDSELVKRILSNTSIKNSELK